MKNLLTPNRREAVGTMLLDTWKLILLLALASNVFIKYNLFIGLGAGGIFFVLLIVIALFLPPSKDPARSK